PGRGMRPGRRPRPRRPSPRPAPSPARAPRRAFGAGSKKAWGERQQGKGVEGRGAAPPPASLLREQLLEQRERARILGLAQPEDRKSTRLNSSHVSTSYA